MSIEQRTTKLLAVSTLVLCASVGAYYYGYQRVGSLTEQVATARAAATLERAEQDAELRAAEFVRQVTGEFDAARTLLVSLDDPTPFLSAIEEVGAIAQVTLEVESVGETALTEKEQAVQALPSIDVALSATGRFEEVYRFLTLLEHMPYALRVRSVSLSATESATLWEAKVTARASAE